MSIQLNHLLPIWLTLLLIGALFGALLYGTAMLVRKQIAPKLIVILSCVRLAIFAAFVLILLQPAVSYTSSVAQLPEMVVLVDASQSMGKTSGGGTRLDEVRSALERGELAANLRNSHRLHWFTFAGSAKPLDETELAALQAAGASTQFAESIDAAYTQVRAVGTKPQRLLLVSDGNDHGQSDPVETARRLGLIVDVLAPSVGKPAEAPPVEIAEVQCARRVLMGSDTHFRVTFALKQPAPKDQKLLLRVTEDGKKILDYPLAFKAGRTEQTLQLTYRPAGAGLKQYEFQLATSDEKAKPYPLAVQVLDSKYEVLILEDRWRWEYKYLHRLFEDDPSFRFSALLARGGGAFVQFGSPDRRVNLIGFPQGPTDLEGFDTFVLGDVNPALWPRGVGADLARQITDGGKSLVVVAGPGLANLLEIPELHAILPVELTLESGKPLEGPIEVRQRSDGANSPFFFRLRTSEAEKLPPLDQIYPALRKRPGATVLLEAAKERNAYGSRIVIAEHTVGRGRVLFLATDTLWKWHTLAATNEGPTPYSIFWQQAFRAMTPTRSNVGAVNLWLTPNRSRTEVDRPIVITAEVQSSRALSSVNLQASVTSPDEKRLPLVFRVDPANPNLYRTEFSCTQPGLHRVSASLLAEGKIVAEATTAIQTDDPRGELADVGVDLANLARIAQATGGNVIDPARPETWPPSPEADLPRISQMHTVDLWSNFTLILVLCGFLGIDWFTRLFKGLVSG